MMDPTSYLSISTGDGGLPMGGLASGAHSLSDFEQSISDASSASTSHYGDPFVGGLSYFDHPANALTTAAPTTSPSRAPALSPTDMAANPLNQHHHHHHHHHHLSQHHHHHLHSNSHHHANNHQHHSHNHHYSSLAAGPSASSASSSLMLNINNFTLDQLVDHADELDDDNNPANLHYLDQSQLDQADPGSSFMITGFELNEDDDDDLIHGTLTSFVCADLGSESDNGYTSSVSDGLFTSSSSLVDCSDSLAAADAYCFKQLSFSDLHGLIDVGSSAPKQMADSTEKRSVLMNLLIYGSDIGAGYTSIKR